MDDKLNIDEQAREFEIDEKMDILDTLKDIKKLIKPVSLILFHRKLGHSGQTLSFKICVVIDVKNKLEVEKNIYKDIDSDIPFDVIIYTQEEWNQLKLKKHSFANKILKRGNIINE